MTHHGVEFLQVLDDSLDLLNGLALRLGEFLYISGLCGNELMQRGIEETDGNGVAFHCKEQLLEVALLQRQDLLKRFFTLFSGIRADHLAECIDTVLLEEHMLGTAQTDTFGTELAGLLGIPGRIGIGTNLELAVLVSPCHNTSELTGDGCVNGSDRTVVNVTSSSVK